MSDHKFEYDAACPSCGATGLYVGMAESNGAAVVCNTCKGTGQVHWVVEWDDFLGLRVRPDVTRVLRVNPGIGVGAGTTASGVTVSLEDFGGVPYREWIDDPSSVTRAGTEMRRFTCPAWWYQSANYDLKPDWEECSLGAFSSCESFPQKAGCWERFDAEQEGVTR